MTIHDIGTELVSLCRQGKNFEAIEKFYDANIVSVEARELPGIGQVQTGIEAIKRKNAWWFDNHDVHHVDVSGPFFNGDRFAVHFRFDVTSKHAGKRTTMEEIGVYTVEHEKIVKEEFFY
ncbi:MAG: nuclear transport factor 2 family protein [Nitrospirae bacterium]|nr:MAG: nuclear transport factor 2 family protein [Nitrospirota bacterium]